MTKKTYTQNDVREALIEHVKDINHQLSLKIGKLHDREGYDATALLMMAKSQALNALATIAPIDNQE